MLPGCQISIQPPAGLIDGPLAVKISGLAAGQKITLRCQTTDEGGLNWPCF